MKTLLLLPSLLLAASLPGLAEDKPLLAIPGKVIYEDALADGFSGPWKAAKGAWEKNEGFTRGSEKPEDKHGAVTRLPNKLGDFVLEYECKLEGAKATSLSINAPKGHLARIVISPQFVTIQKDDSDHEGPDKAVVFARIATETKSGWHKVRMEMVGDTMLGKFDDIVAWGSHEAFKQERISPGFTVGGQSADFRNIKISEASLNPEWDKVRAGLPKPGENMAPAPTGPKKAKPE